MRSANQAVGVRLVDTGSAQFAMDETGPAAAPVLVLLHAGNTTSTMWDPLVPRLAASHRVIRYDARGFGTSSPITGHYLGSDDVTSVLDALGVERATLIGSSFGGRVALDTALAAPDLLAGVVMIGSRPSGAPFALTPDEQALADAADEAEAAGDWALRAELDVDIWSVGPTRRRDQVEPGFLAQALTAAHQHEDLLEKYPAAYCDAGEPPAIERLAELSSPLLSIVGEHDLAVIREQQDQTLLTAGGGGHGALIANAAHFPSIEQPTSVLGVLLPWLVGHEL